MNAERKIEGDNSRGGSDDEISVIAVIKKGSSGIPKRARYHYIRELPLMSVKALKKSIMQRADESQISYSPTATSEIEKKPRVIELSDEISKMELRRQFEIPEKNVGEDEETLRSTLNRSGGDGSLLSGGDQIVHKLPPGTVLIKQEPNCTNIRSDLDVASTNLSGRSGTGTGTTTTATATTTTTESSSSSSNSNSSSASSSSVSSFGSGSGSPSAKVKRLHRGSRGGGAKKVLDVIPRRNPKRCSSSKKDGTVTRAQPATQPATTTATTGRRPRERQRLLATRRQEKNDTVTEYAGTTNARTRPTSTMPYMNTRSVTRKLYTVGATYQPPTRKDEMEWREWPAHGMHERPVFHPRIGLAAGYGGRIFWATSDADGFDWKYREVLDGGEEVEVVAVDPESEGIGEPRSPFEESSGVDSGSESFDVCMHESLHCVLAYCAQIMAPDYRRRFEKKRRYRVDVPVSERKDAAAATLRTNDPENLDIPELEDSSISDETLMEMSSIYKKLLPADEQPSSEESSAPSSTRASPFPGGEKPAGIGGLACRSPVPKNSSEASEIARILSEYNEGLKEPKTVAPSVDGGGKRASGEPEPHTSNVGGMISTTSEPRHTFGAKHFDGKWLEELLVDTSLLYCVANGVDQRDLTRYIDTLDAKQSLKWLRRRDG